MASEVRRHPFVAHGVLGPPHDLADRVDQKRLSETPDPGVGRNLPGEFALGGTFAHAVFARPAHDLADLRLQIGEGLCEEVHTLDSAKGVRHSSHENP